MNRFELKLFDRFRDSLCIERTWKEFESDKTPYFLSWGWVEHWLSSLPKELELHLAVVYENGFSVLAFFICKKLVTRHNIMRNKTYYLNATGVETFDQLCIEYNSILMKPDVFVSLHDLLDLLPGDWDEFCLPGVAANSFPGNRLKQPCLPYTVHIENESPSPYVDLDAVSNATGGYLSLLGSKTRYNINRSYRVYNAFGEVTCEVADSVENALEIFEEMVELHQQTWEKRGEVGAFSSEFFYLFHKGLISKRFEYGEIQLIRTFYDERTIGCLYNFVWNGKVYSYQSGFKYDSDNRLKPGLVTFHEAINHNATKGNIIFDFLGGNALYKECLSTNNNQLIWARVQKPLVKFKLEESLRSTNKFRKKCLLRIKSVLDLV